MRWRGLCTQRRRSRNLERGAGGFWVRTRRPYTELVGLLRSVPRPDVESEDLVPSEPHSSVFRHSWRELAVDVRVGDFLCTGKNLAS